MTAYAQTTVTTDSSQSSIRKALRAAGATEFQFGETNKPDGTRMAGVEFVHGGHLVRMIVPMKQPNNQEIEQKVRRARSKSRDQIIDEAYEQEERRIWRVLYWSIKARMEAVIENIETFEQAFLSHIVDPASNLTIWQAVQPAVDRGDLKIGGSGLRELGSGIEYVDAEVVDE